MIPETQWYDPEIQEDLNDLASELGPAEGKLFAQLFESMRCPPQRWIDEWADAEYFLPEGTSSEYGTWRTDRFPFLREPMRCLSPASPCREVDAIKGAQLGFTELSKIIMAYTVAENPQPLLYTQKTKDDVEEFSKMKLQPTLEACPTVASKIAQHRSSTGNNSILLKTFPGGFIALGGANTANSVSSKSIGILLCDELDRYSTNVQANGDPVDLAIRRTANYPDHKIFRFTTPAILETSRIDKSFKAGDQRHLYLPCPHCNASAPTWDVFELGDREVVGTYFELTWDRIKYINDDPETAACLCDKCGCLIEEHYKSWMLERALWIPHNPAKPDQKPGDLTVRHASFTISALYSPFGFFSWKDAVRQWLEAMKENDETKLQVFVNTVLGQGWSLAGKGVAANSLEERKTPYSSDGSYQVPGAAVVLTAGADVQPDRIECEVVAWGAGEQSWSVDYVVLWGDTDQDQIWQEFDMMLKRAYRHASGRTMFITAACVDSGYNATKVYKFVLGRESRRIFAVKGDEGWGKGEIQRPLKPHKDYKIWLFRVFVDEMKRKVYSNLRIPTPGPGYCNFPQKPEYDVNYFKMLTVETLREKVVNSNKVLYWYKPEKARNEALDCRVYARAALLIIKVDLDQMAAANVVLGGTMQAPANRPQNNHPRQRVLSRGIG